MNKIIKDIIKTVLISLGVVLLLFLIFFLKGFFKSCDRCLEGFDDKDYVGNEIDPIVIHSYDLGKMKKGKNMQLNISFFNKLNESVPVNIDVEKCMSNAVDYDCEDESLFVFESLPQMAKINESINFNVLLKPICSNNDVVVPIGGYVCRIVVYVCEDFDLNNCFGYKNQTILAYKQVFFEIK